MNNDSIDGDINFYGFAKRPHSGYSGNTSIGPIGQAEGAMLNKGPHIVKTIKELKNIPVRKKDPSLKNKKTLRSLDVAKSSLAKIEK